MDGWNWKPGRRQTEDREAAVNGSDPKWLPHRADASPLPDLVYLKKEGGKVEVLTFSVTVLRVIVSNKRLFGDMEFGEVTGLDLTEEAVSKDEGDSE